MVENFSNLKKETATQIHGVQRVPNNMNLNRLTPRHIIIKGAKVKDSERILRQQEEKKEPL